MRETTCRCPSLVAHSGGGVESRHEISGVLHSRHEIIVKTIRSQQVLEEQWQHSVECHWSDVAAAGCCCVYIWIYMKKERLYQMPVCNDSGCIRAHTPSPLPANAAVHYSLRRIRAFCLLEPDCTLQVRLGDDNKNCLEFSRPLVSFEAKDDRVERWERSISTLWK